MGETNFQEIEIWTRVGREDVRQNKDKIFLFGDNLAGRGFGGQAKEMRGEENAVGIPTKKAPDNNPNSFFSDKEFAENKRAIDEAFARIPLDKTIVIPKAGIGTGLARLSSQAPKTFAYLNEKFAHLGFDNRTGEKIQQSQVTRQQASRAQNQAIEKSVRLQNGAENHSGQKRILDLDNILSPELKPLAPTTEEIKALQTDRAEALARYADRLRQDYKENKNNLREGFRLLSDSFYKGDQITVICSCRGGEMCHADVVKMAIEKVSNFQKQKETKEINKTSRNENAPNKINPRTQRAINEILATSESDKLLEKINQTDGRNRSEQASHLGKHSQFVRDIYERGANLREGSVLLIPQEKLGISPALRITTLEYAAQKIARITGDEAQAKETAPKIVEYADKISGISADTETRLKVFNWIYESLEGKTEFFESGKNEHFSEKERFKNTLEKIQGLADELHSLEPADKIELVPFSGFENEQSVGTAFDHGDENKILEEIYEDSLAREPLETDESLEQSLEKYELRDFEASRLVSTETFERIDLINNAPPRIPPEFTEVEINRLLTKTLPEIDRRLESGEKVSEILKPFNELVWQSGRDDTLNRLEKIYQKQKLGEIEQKLSDRNLPPIEKNKLESEKQIWKNAALTPTRAELREIVLDREENPSLKNNTDELKKVKTVSRLAGNAENLSESVLRQIEKINLRRPNVIELKTPGEFPKAEKRAVQTFFRKLTLETAGVQAKLDEIHSNGDKTSAQQLKKELKTVQELKPSFAFKLAGSTEAIVGNPSKDLIAERNFAQSYINYQLRQPETRLRHENERYRRYAARLETAITRDDLIKAASEIRAENASVGFNWKTLEKSEKQNLQRPLTVREMQFLFTEASPKHYTSEMTAIRLSYAHSGVSRRQMTESLLRREIAPSPEAQNLIESLGSRLARRELKDAIGATKHFFESIKLPNEKLKLKNEFDHLSVYKQLPPQEKDFIYERAVHQKENLEYRLAFRQYVKRERQTGESSLQKPEASKAEKSFLSLSRFFQARSLGEKLESSHLLTQELNGRDVQAASVLLTNETPEKIESISQELSKAANPEIKRIGEILNTFSKAEIAKDGDKTTIQITLSENSILSRETYAELLEKFYPDDAKESEKYNHSNLDAKEIARAREAGQNEAINFIKEEVKNSVGSQVSEEIIQAEKAILEKLDFLTEMQDAGRTARHENTGMIESYSNRAAKSQNLSFPPLSEQMKIVAAAFGLADSRLAANKINDKFFETVQEEITVSDFKKFTENVKTTKEIALNIRKEFSEISRLENILEKNKPRETAAGISHHEKLPASLKIYESEINRAEKELFAARLNEKFGKNESFSDKENLDLESIFTTEEKKQIKENAADIAKERLEPKELEASNHNLPPELSHQAFATYKQLEKAHNLYLHVNDKRKITESFSKLDGEAARLNRIRQDYNRSEIVASLRENLKIDLADLLKTDAGANEQAFINQAGKILSQNLEKVGAGSVISDKTKINVLSKEIFQNLEVKQNLKASHFTHIQIFDNHKLSNLNENKITGSQIEKSKNYPVFRR